MSATAVTNVPPVRAWILAARPTTLPAAAVPVIVGAAAGASESGTFKLLVFIITLTCALLIQIGTNFSNDYSDFRRGADNDDRLGPVRVTQSGLISQTEIKTGILVAFGLAVLLGVVLAWFGGWPIILIGVFSVLSGLAYTGGPYPLGYNGLGDVFVFVFFGLVAVTGAAYLQTGEWSALPLMLSVPIGLLTTNILVVNNLRDLPTDRVAGKHTLAVSIGESGTRAQYVLFIAVSYLIPAAVALTDRSRRMLVLPLLTLPLAIGLVRAILSGTSGRELNPVLKRTAMLLLFFGIALTAGILVRT